jgi:uncharacterized membrane protein YfcA
VVETVPIALIAVLAPLVVLVAAAYASVGLGGGTGYLAVMALAGVPHPVMAPTALLLNLIVTGMALLNFGLAGRMRWRLFLPFLLPAVPAAFAGGLVSTDRRAFLALLAVALATAGVSMIRTATRARDVAVAPRPAVLLGVAIPCGAAIGLLSGFLGVGGGVFLGPLILLLGWAGPKEVAGMNSCLILVVSAVALAAHGVRGGIDPALIVPLGAAALTGGLVGSTLAVKRLSPSTLQRVFAAIVLVAAVKAGWDAVGG